MRTPSHNVAETPWERARMEQIVRADIAAFGAGRAEMANAIVEQSGMRVRPERGRGRSAGINPSGRFEPVSRHVFDDGWNSLEELPPFRTEVQVERPREAVDAAMLAAAVGIDRAVEGNVGRFVASDDGARPTHAYMGLSAGLDFEAKLFAKPDAAKLLDRELSKPDYQPRTIAIGTNTDPYQPIERTHRIMREILEVLDARNHPVGIVTKSALVMRDVDILARMAAKGLAKVAFSVTTLDRKLARTMEPRAATPPRRLEAMRALADAGIPVSVMVAPVVPGLNDAEIERILDAAYAAGAREAGYIILRLPLEVSPIFKDWLLRHYPDRYRHVMSLVRSMRGGKDYDSEWGKRMKGSGPYAWQIGRRFEIAARRLGFNAERRQLRTDLFAAATKESEQLVLL